MRQTRISFCVVILTVVMMACSGCYLRNGLAIPGTKDEQRIRAVVHDPFPVTGIGIGIVDDSANTIPFPSLASGHRLRVVVPLVT